MLTHAEVMAFSATTHPAEALTFYRDVLGLRLVEDQPYALVFQAGATMLRVQKAHAPYAPPPHTLLGWRVDDLAATMRSLVDRGVVFARFDGLPQDEHGVWSTPDGTKVAWFHDPDRNVLSLTQFS